MSDHITRRRPVTVICPEPEPEPRTQTVQLYPGIVWISEPVRIEDRRVQTVRFRYYRHGTGLQASVTAENGRPVFIKPWRDQPPMLCFQVEYLDADGTIRSRSAMAGYYKRGSAVVLTNPPEPYDSQTLAEFPELLDWLQSLGFIADKIR